MRYLTLFAFSTENWKRPRREINPLMRLVGRVIDRELNALHENNVRLLHLGSLDPLSSDLQRRVRDAIELTKDNDRPHRLRRLQLRRPRRDRRRRPPHRRAKASQPSRSTKRLSSGFLGTAGLPDPDLVIRTAGEMRLSNFLLWQAAYAEYYSTPAYWPDFDEAEVDRAIEAYGQRVRRFGGLNGDEPAATSNGNGVHA